jgi:uncharacterized membrane protein (DUF2068 family)
MQRPGGVTLIAVLDFIFAGLCVILALLFFAGGSFLSSFFSAAGAEGGGLLGGAVAVIGVVFLLIAGLLLATGIGLLKLAAWARILAIVLAAIHLLLTIKGLVSGMQMMTSTSWAVTILFLAYDAWVIWYLLQAKVKQAFTQKAA